MANNFKNAFATNVSMSSGTPTDVYTSATGGSGVNSILIEPNTVKLLLKIENLLFS